MSLVASRVSVTDAASIVFDDGDGLTALALRNVGSSTAYVGPVGVIDSTGFPVEEGEVLHLSALAAVDVVYGICAAGESTTLALLAKDPA